MSDGGVALCCLLWAREGQRAGLTARADERDRVIDRTELFPVRFAYP